MAVESVRELARLLGLSHTTVSDALRNHPRVRASTRELVQREAVRHGYRYNPLVGALMSEIRRGGVGTFRGTIAILDLESDQERDAGARDYHRALTEGARRAAADLGFGAEPFLLGRHRLTIPRLGQVLETRGIRGVLLLPVAGQPDLDALPWDRLAGIYTDYVIEHPRMDCVCSDHYRSMVVLLDRVRALGYRRPGFAISTVQDERLLHRWEAAFRTMLRYRDDLEATEPLLEPDLGPGNFGPWFRRERPDIVLCHRSEVLDWMRDAGAEVPRTHGFACLNVRMSRVPAAGLDLRPELLGARAVQALAARIHRNEYGLPENPSIESLPAVWVDGPTVREVSDSPKRRPVTRRGTSGQSADASSPA